MTQTTINVGDAVLFVSRRGRDFECCKVTKVTKESFTIDKELTGGRTAPYRFQLRASSQWGGPDKPQQWYHEAYRAGKYGSDRYCEVYADTPEARAVLQERADEARRQEEEKTRERQRREDERNAEIAHQLAEVRAAFGCLTDEEMPPARIEHLPDGGRLYTIAMPVKSEFVESKKGWERVIVRCWNEQEPDFHRGQTITVVRSAYTYCNGGSHSFSSVSTARHESDHEAVWDACRSQFHRW